MEATAARWLHAGPQVTGYGNALGALVAALFGARGLAADGNWANKRSFGLFIGAAIEVAIVVLLFCTGLVAARARHRAGRSGSLI